MRKGQDFLKKVFPFDIDITAVRFGFASFINVLYTRLFNIASPKAPPLLTWITTFDCNAYCKFCATHKVKHSCQESVPYEKLIKTAHEIGKAGTFVVGFSGGEVLMCHYLFDVIKVLHSYGVKTYIVTNGLLLREKADEILQSKVELVVVSIDSSTAEEHDNFRGFPGLYEILRDGIQYIKSKRENSVPLIKATTILNKKNIPKINVILDDLKAFTDTQSLQPIVTGYHENSPHSKAEEGITSFMFQPEDRPQLQHYINELIKNHPDFNSYYFRQIPTYYFDRERLLEIQCWSPFFRMMIMPNGDVVHCLANPKYPPIGNIKDSTIMEIWNSREMFRQREEIRLHKNNCICWTQDASFNQLIHNIPLFNRIPVFKKHK
ncbi:MAG: radical SAM protein [Nitrospirae bacterium]|nr:radical SAM protein [Nitrospirota bacterium]